jgi:hypothetical protein
MSATPVEFHLRSTVAWLTPSHKSFRPPSWPPPGDWVVSEDRDGNVLALWRDPKWDLSPWAGRPLTLDFGDGPDSRKASPIDLANAKLLRLLTTWRIWGPRAVIAANTLNAWFSKIRRIVALCSEKGILASELMRFPAVLEDLPSIIEPSNFERTITELHRLWDARAEIGFVLVDPDGIKRLAAVRPDHEMVQTAYIPPRIWTYQVERLRECLDDFLSNAQQVEDCFNYCVDAYAHNYGSLRAAMTTPWGQMANRLPFAEPRKERAGARTGCRYLGQFALTAQRFGIQELLERWVMVPESGLGLKQLSGYLTLVQCVGLAFIANFSLQRINEAASLRADCLTWENDPKLGRIPILCGETTKTDPDSDARWPTSPSVELAVVAMSKVSRLRMRCAAAHPKVCPSDADQVNPYLLDGAFEPWVGSSAKPYSVRSHTSTYLAVLRRNPKLLDPRQLKITSEDLKIALMLTPNLSGEAGFEVGKLWPLAWHQLRRTGAVNMYASGLLSDSSMQFLMKHASRYMPLYYGRGYTKLRLSEDVERVVVAAMYEAMANQLLAAMSDRFVSPHGDSRKQAILVNLVVEKDAKKLASAAQNGQTTFREIRLGACTNRELCTYGGIESIARCAGGDGDKACADVLFDKTKAPEAEKDQADVDRQLSNVAPDSPRHAALLAEHKGLENYLDVVGS